MDPLSYIVGSMRHSGKLRNHPKVIYTGCPKYLLSITIKHRGVYCVDTGFACQRENGLDFSARNLASRISNPVLRPELSRTENQIQRQATRNVLNTKACSSFESE